MVALVVGGWASSSCPGCVTVVVSILLVSLVLGGAVSTPHEENEIANTKSTTWGESTTWGDPDFLGFRFASVFPCTISSSSSYFSNFSIHILLPAHDSATRDNPHFLGIFLCILGHPLFFFASDFCGKPSISGSHCYLSSFPATGVLRVMSPQP